MLEPDANRAGVAGGAVLITGGAGFVGTNLAARLLADGRSVLLFDNLSRAGAERNLAWLQANHGRGLRVKIGDVRDAAALRDAVALSTQVFHFAARAGVTSSLADPVADFDVSLRGTLNLLEAVRAAPRPPPVVFASTTKVYGALEDVDLETFDQRYRPTDARVRATGVSEARPLSFHGPYACSKGGADQYVLDYARSYGIRAVVLRLSCIYGPHQFGNEDQGWVAHFLIRALERLPITVHGDGRQVRDILFVDDLVDALLLCQERMSALSGHAFNLGGGPGNTVSLLELIERIGKLVGRSPATTPAPWRSGDQRYFVSDTHAFTSTTGWRPQVGVADGVARLLDWLRAQPQRAEQLAAEHAA